MTDVLRYIIYTSMFVNNDTQQQQKKLIFHEKICFFGNKRLASRGIQR